jgi:Fur family ferric uptake transcriptional regulator
MGLSEIGAKSSRQRNAIMEAFAAAKKHLTIDELFEDVKLRRPNIGYTTVWRTLKLLESCGQAVARKFHDGFTRYEFAGTKTHHDHLICVKCGKVEEFANPKIEEIQKKIAHSHKFKMTAHKMELYGYCKKCGK